MQIALTNKLIKTLNINPSPNQIEEDPLFTWTANWITAWNNRRSEDTLVLVNHANRYTITIYQLKRKDLKDIKEIQEAVIENTLLSENINPKIVEEYIHKAGELPFVKNTNRKATACLKNPYTITKVLNCLSR